MARSNHSGVPFSSKGFSSVSDGRKPNSKRTKSANEKTSGRSNPLLKAGEEPGPSRKKIVSEGKLRRRLDVNEQDLNGLNVYDYVAAPVKNARTQSKRFELSREEAELAGNKRRTGVKLDDDSAEEDSGEDGDMAARIRRAALVIAGEEALQLADDDDEELDSDDAWNSDSDVERWGKSFGVKPPTTSKTQVQQPSEDDNQELAVDLSESDDELDQSKGAEETFAFEAEDAAENSDYEDNDGDEEDGDNEAAEDDDEDEDEDEVELDEPTIPSDEEPEDMDDGDETNLLEFVSTLPTVGKRKAEDLSMEIVTPAGLNHIEKRRKVLASVHGPGGKDDAGEFGVAPVSRLSLSALVASDPSLKSTAASLLKAADTRNSGSTLKSGTMAAPLPTVVIDRMAREAAYEQTAQEGAKWGAVMKRIKEAEQLKFPLQVGGTASQGSSKDRQRGGVKSGGDLMGGFQATNELESAVTRLLESANLKDGQIVQAEEDALEGQDLTVDEIAARRAELRRQRELLFREESRRKRIAKIKSKTYRKIARKRADKAEGEIDLDDLRALDPARAEEEQNKMEIARARERATLKHSAKGGRWAQSQHGAGEIDGKRQELEYMLAQKERLRRKVQGKGSEASDSETGSEDDGEAESDPRERAYDELAVLQTRQAALDQEVASSKPTGIFAMKFMQNAAQKAKARVDEEEEELRKQLEAYEDLGIESDDDDDDQSNQDNVLKTKGRLVLSGNNGEADGLSRKDKLSTPSVYSGDQVDNQHHRLEENEKTDVPVAYSSTAGQSVTVNPWLNVGSGTVAQSRKKNAVMVGKDGSAASRATEALRKQKNVKTSQAKLQLLDDAKVEIDSNMDQTKTLPLDVDSDDEGDHELENVRKGPKAFSQRDLVAQAFAGDNVVEDFAAEKLKAIEKDAPKEQDLTLAGWGSWGGKGVKKSKNARKFTKTVPGIDATQRKDFGKSNVILSEKKAKADKYLSTSLPFPYTSQSQYEQALSSNTIAPETSTMGGFQRGIAPRIIKKPGAILQPLRKLHNS